MSSSVHCALYSSRVVWSSCLQSVLAFWHLLANRFWKMQSFAIINLLSQDSLDKSTMAMVKWIPLAHCCCQPRMWLHTREFEGYLKGIRPVKRGILQSHSLPSSYLRTRPKVFWANEASSRRSSFTTLLTKQHENRSSQMAAASFDFCGVDWWNMMKPCKHRLLMCWDLPLKLLYLEECMGIGMPCHLSFDIPISCNNALTKRHERD